MKNENLDEIDLQNEMNVKEKPKKQKSQYYVFLILTIFVGVVVFFLAVILTIRVLGNKGNNKDNQNATIKTTNPTTIAPLTTVEETKKDENGNNTIAAAIIKEIKTEEKSIFIYAYNAGKTYSLFYTDESVLKDKYNKDIVYGELKVGDIIDVEFFSKSKNIINLKVSADTWEKENVSGLVIKDSNKTITIDKNVYAFDPQITVIRKGYLVELNTIQNSDLLYIKGTKNNLLYIEILKTNGILELINKDKIKNGTIEVGTALFSKFEENVDSFKIFEGKYTLVIKGDNIDDFNKEIEIVEAEKTIVDLTEVEVKSGALTIKANVTDFKFYINNKLYETSEPIILDYGKYKIKIEKDGYNTMEEEITIKDPVLSAQFSLVEEVVLGKVGVTTEPSGAEVFIDNLFIGLSAVTSTATLGEHTITVKKEGYITMTYPIIVDEKGKSYNIILNKEVVETPVLNTPINTPVNTPINGDDSNDENKEEKTTTTETSTEVSIPSDFNYNPETKQYELRLD